MTTIAYKDGVLAGDTRLSDDDGHIWSDACRKVFKFSDGSLFAASGDNEAGELLLKALTSGEPIPSLPEDCSVTAIRVYPNREVYVTEGHTWSKWTEPFVAIGSGKRCAMTAMRLGHDAVTAVKAGIAGDVFSGGKVQTVKLKGIK